MDLFFNAVIEANLEILRLLQNGSHKEFCQKISIGAGGDMSRKIDVLAEDIFIKHLKKFGNIYSEECGFLSGIGEDDIIIDPIDGSNNFMSNLPYFGTSVALKYKDTYKAAVVTNLANGDIFLKDKNKFQRANLQKLTFSEVSKNPNSCVGIFERTYCSEIVFEKLKNNYIKYRSPGAFALSLAYAHDVDFVIYEGKMRIYDIAAGLYMCEDLNILKKEEFLLISKDKETFDRIAQLF